MASAGLLVVIAGLVLGSSWPYVPRDEPVAASEVAYWCHEMATEMERGVPNGVVHQCVFDALAGRTSAQEATKSVRADSDTAMHLGATALVAQALSDGPDEDRSQAIMLLTVARLASPVQLGAIVRKALKDGRPVVQQVALVAACAGALDLSSMEDRLWALVEPGTEPGVMAAAMLALGDRNTKGVRPLEPLWQRFDAEGDPSISAFVSYVFVSKGRAHQADARSFLLRQATSPPGRGARLPALDLLALLSEKAAFAVPTLRRITASETGLVQGQAIAALACTGQAGRAGIPELRDVVLAARPNAWAAFMAIRRLDPSGAVPQALLHTLVEDPRPECQQIGAAWSGPFLDQDSELAGAVVALALNGPDSMVGSALGALAQVDRLPTGALEAALRGAGIRSAQDEAARLLGRLAGVDDGRVLPRLLPLTQDERLWVRDPALVALGRFSGEAVKFCGYLTMPLMDDTEAVHERWIALTSIRAMAPSLPPHRLQEISEFLGSPDGVGLIDACISIGEWEAPALAAQIAGCLPRARPPAAGDRAP